MFTFLKDKDGLEKRTKRDLEDMNLNLLDSSFENSRSTAQVEITTKLEYALRVRVKSTHHIQKLLSQNKGYSFILHFI